MNRSSEKQKNWLRRNWIGLVICVYQAILLLFLFAELGVPMLADFRATNQVLLLFALLFLPFVLIASATVIRSIRLKLQGQDIEIEFGRIQRLEQVGHDLGGRLGGSEQVLATILAGPDPYSAKRLEAGRLIIGAKEFRSSRFLAHLLAHCVQRRVKAVSSCRPHWPNGSTLKNFADLKNGRIDLYVEYTGTACQMLGLAPQDDLALTLSGLNALTVPRYGLEWLEPLGAVDNFKVVVLRKFAEEKKLKTIHDLAAKADSLAFCALSEFFNRRDGYDGLCERYRLKFKRRELCGPSNNYDLLETGEVDVIIGWDSDARLKETDLFAPLVDVEHYFPDYHAVPLVRVEALDSIRGLRESLASLNNAISTSALQDQSELIRIRGDDRAVVDAVAEEFLSNLRPALSRDQTTMAARG